jgi:hypothetical protein
MKLKLNIRFPKPALQASAAVLIASSVMQMPVAHADAVELFTASVLQRSAPPHADTSRSAPEAGSDAASQFIECCLIGENSRLGLVAAEAGADADGMNAPARFVRDVMLRQPRQTDVSSLSPATRSSPSGL